MRVAVIGLGVIGKVHVQSLKDLNEELVAVCDVDESKFSLVPDVPHYTDYVSLLEEVKPEVVHICTPHYLHAEMICAALERNINVLCEKPMCIHAEDIPHILEVEQRSRAKLGVCHQNRYNAANLFVKEYLKDKRVLEGSGNVIWHRDAEYYHSGAWRGKWKTEGGGVLINQALHTLDLLQWFVGEPSYVTATVSNLTLKDVIEVEDTAFALYSGGAQFSFFATNGAGRGFPVEISLQTEQDEIKILKDNVILNGKLQNFQDAAKLLGKECYGTGHERLIADFYRCIREDRQFSIDGKEAAKVVKLILGAYASNGRTIKL